MLASFIAGLAGEVGKQVRFSNLQNLDQALATAWAVQEAIRQEINENFHAKTERSMRWTSKPLSRAPAKSESRNVRNKAGDREYNQ
jgi:hypothetical protein